jgi:hypothetical protein
MWPSDGVPPAVPAGGVKVEGAVALERRRTLDTGRDPQTDELRVAKLRAAVSRLCRELACHPADLPDRAVAEDELATLGAMARHGEPDVTRLRRSLLLVASALGSVSALAPTLGELREVIDSFGELPRPRPGD